MHIFTNILGFSIPSYGLIITIGLIISNFIAFIFIHQNKDDINDFIILEASGMLGAFLGAKLLYLIVSLKDITWNKLSFSYFNQLMQGGFVFFGGLLGALFFILISGKSFQINVVLYLKKYIFLFPFLHAFGRIGCFMAGCCYGVPYNGPCAVVFPENSLALPETPLFPVQMVEALLLFFLSAILIILCLKKKSDYTISVYLISYSIIRFLLEFLRYDQRRGVFYGLSVSQWISITIFLITFSYSRYIRK